ncbi:hypothetical protein [Congregicoccus parvus]|uniref:hypothetical protein n=1 Tax=Congregicoccus parvus TaxID=3081749 RepID=UPI003FA60299
MKKLGFILVLALVAAVFGYFAGRARFERHHAHAVHDGSDIAWIQREFDLDDATFATVRALHEDYAGVCAQHCFDIVAAQERLEQLRRSGADAAAITAAETELARLEAVCNEATRAHIYRVAAKMPLEAGVRFIRATEPHLASMPHDGSRGLSR